MTKSGPPLSPTAFFREKCNERYTKFAFFTLSLNRNLINIDMNTKGYPTRKFTQATKRYVQMLDLRNDPELIQQYIHYHSREGIWPEILEGLKNSGVLEMEIYQLDDRLMMIVELDANDDWDEIMSRMGNTPRQEEWEAFVSRFQKANALSKSEEKWRMMERIFQIYD